MEHSKNEKPLRKITPNKLNNSKFKNSEESYIPNSSKLAPYDFNDSNFNKTLNESLSSFQLNKLNIKKENKKTNIKNYDNSFQDQRKEIYIAKSLSQKVSLCFNLISLNRKKLINYIIQKRITNPAEDSNSFHFYLDYFYNYLLLFNLLLSSNNMNDAYSTLYHLCKEMKKSFNIEKYIYNKIYSQNDKYHMDILYFIKFCSSLLQCTLKLGKNYLYEIYLLKYIDIIESISENNMLLPFLYYYVANLLVELDYLKYSIYAYDLSFKYLNDYIRKLRLMKMGISILYNKGLIYYVSGKDIKDCVNILTECKKMKLKEIEENNINNIKNNNILAYRKGPRLSINKNVNNEKDNQLLTIYFTLFEIDYNNKNSEKISDYINFIMTNKSILTQFEKEKFNYILDLINKRLNYNNNNNDTEINNKSILSKSITKSFSKSYNNNINNNLNYTNYNNNNFYTSNNSSNINNNIINLNITSDNNTSLNKNQEEFIDYCLIKTVNKPEKIKVDPLELQKFFLFLTKLNQYQIELLNKEQPDCKDIKKFGSMPIYFSNNFKMSLNLEQMNLLKSIKILCLRRKIILKKLTEPISLENLDLQLIYESKNENNITITQLNNIKNIHTKINDYEKEKSLNKMNKTIIKPKESFNNITSNFNLIRSDSIPLFKYQNKIPYESIKATLKKYLKINPILKYKNEELLKDNIIIKLLNKMKLDEIKTLNDNPMWLIEIMIEYKEKIDKNENSQTSYQEENTQEKIEEGEKEKEEETISDKDNDEKNDDKSIDLIDAMNMGKE